MSYTRQHHNLAVANKATQECVKGSVPEGNEPPKTDWDKGAGGSKPNTSPYREENKKDR